MKFSDLFTDRDGRLSRNRVAFWLFFVIFLYRYFVFGPSEITTNLMSFVILLFAGYEGFKMWSLRKNGKS